MLHAAPYASWGRRAVGYTLDLLIVVGALMLVLVALIVPARVGGGAAEGAAVALMLVLVFLGPAAYYVYFVGNERGQTYGRRALGIQVRDGETRGPIGYGRSFGRYAIVFVFGLLTFPLIFDYLWPLWDGMNQTLHDKMVGSVVLDIRPGVEGVRAELALRRGWSVGRAAVVVIGALVGAAVVGRLGIAINHSLTYSVIDGVMFICGAVGGAALGAAVGFAVFGWRTRPARSIRCAGRGRPGRSRSGRAHGRRQPGGRPLRRRVRGHISPTKSMFAVGAMMGAAVGAFIGGLIFLIWASRLVRKPEARVGGAAPA